MDAVNENVPNKTVCRCEFAFLRSFVFTPLFLEQIIRMKIKDKIHIRLEIPIHLLCVSLVKNNNNEEIKEAAI